MPDPAILLQAGLSNAVLAIPLGLIAFAVQRQGKRPQLAHMLWLLVLLKLLTPPLITMPLMSLSLFDSTPVLAAQAQIMVIGSSLAAMSGGVAGVDYGQALSLQFLLLMVWGAVSVLFAGYSIIRIVRFNRLLSESETPVTRELALLTSEVANELSLSRVPSVHVTTARVSPMIWSGFRTRLYLPMALTERLDTAQMRCVIAHELSHVKRGDHFTRWIEWLAMILFFWHPLLWVARRGLHEAEEVCCDRMVIETLNPVRKEYALTIARVMRLLIQSLKPPEMASPINGGHQLQRRIDMMLIPTNAVSRMSRCVLLVLAAAMLPLGLLQADSESDYQAMQKRLDAAILAGDLTPLQAEERRQAFLRRQQEEADPQVAKREAVKRRIREIRTAHAQGHLTDEEVAEAIRTTRASLVTDDAREVPAAEAEQSVRTTIRHARGGGEHAGLEDRLRRIRAAHAEGELTDDEAEAAYRRIREHQAKAVPQRAQGQQEHDGWEWRLRRIRTAHAEGKLTDDEAEAAYQRIRQAQEAASIRE